MKQESRIKDYLDELSSNSPTPGGGNVSAFCGLLAACLGTMVCNLTAGKKKYAEYEPEIQQLREELSLFRPEFLKLAQADNDAFEKVMDAFKLPKNTDDEKTARNSAVLKATIGAAVVPAQVIHLCGEVLPILERLVTIGNQNSLSDTAVGIGLIACAAEGAFLNVLINCAALTDESEARQLLDKSKQEYEAIISSKGQLTTGIIHKLQAQP